MRHSEIIGQAHEQNFNAYWQAVHAKTPFVAFGGEENELVRFHNVPNCPFNGQGFYGREWFVQQQKQAQ